MTTVIAIIAFLIGLCLIISLHELGHFIFAKKAGILCYEYSIGMGPLIYGKKKGETQYSIRAIPIGGYVSMAGEQLLEGLVKKEDIIGLDLEDGKVKYIIFNDSREAQIKGKVVSADLYDADNKGMFIEIEVNGNITRYDVLEEAFYIDKKKKVQVTPYRRSFESKSLLQRFLSIFAGPGMNFILALVLFLIVSFATGVPNTKSSKIGDLQKNYTIAGEKLVAPGYRAGIRSGSKIISINGNDVSKWKDISVSLDNLIDEGKASTDISYIINGETVSQEIKPMIYIANLGVVGNFFEDDNETGALVYVYTTKAKKQGIKDGDIIVKINDTAINGWDDLLVFCRDAKSGEKVNVTVLRDSESKSFNIDMLEDKTITKALEMDRIEIKLGISPKYHFDFFKCLKAGFVSVLNALLTVFNTLGLLFSSNDVHVSDLSGPVGIFTLVKNSLMGGFLSYLSFMAFLSANIGFINILPIPALDGGRLVFLGYEGITKKKINRKVENNLNNIMFILLMVLFIYITFNDIIRLFK